MTQTSLPSTLQGAAVYNTPHLQLVVLQIFAQLQHDRDIARSQYQMAKFQLSREEDRCRKEQMRRMTAEHQMNEQVAGFQARTQATMETAAEVQRLLEKAKQESYMALEQAARFKELSGKKDALLSKLKSDLKILENYVQMSIKDTKLVQHLAESRRDNLQRTLDYSSLLDKKLLETMKIASDFQRREEDRELLLKSTEGKLEVTQSELQSAKDQIKDLQEALLKANQNGASCEAKYQISVEEANNLKNLMKADKEVLVQTWVQGNATVQRLQLALEDQKNRSQQEQDRARTQREEETKRHKEQESSSLQEKQKLQEELQLERSRSSSLQLILAQNVTSGLANLSTVITAYSKSQAFCQEEKQKLVKKLEDEKRICDERISATTQKIVNDLQQLKDTTNANRQISEHIKQKLLADLESERRLRENLPSSLSSSVSSQVQRLETALQSHHLNVTNTLGTYIVRPKENLKKLPYIVNGRERTEVLFAASRNGNITEIEVLLDAGVPIESKDSRYQETPLIWAAEYGRLGACRFLLERGANINARASSWGNRTPLHAAAVNNRLDVIKLLVEMGADLAAKDSDGKAPTEVGNDTTKAWFRNRSG